MAASSDPGLAGALRDDRDSLATLGSDEEPLEGDTAEHVEAMLRSVLDPDERLSDDEDVADPLLYESSRTATLAAGIDLASLADSELDELDEAAQAAQHAQALSEALDGFQLYAEQALNDAHSPPPPPPPPPDAGPPLGAVPARLRELRELQRELRQLALLLMAAYGRGVYSQQSQKLEQLLAAAAPGPACRSEGGSGSPTSPKPLDERGQSFGADI